MLVLTRKEDERIRVELPSGEAIWINVLRVRGDKVRLGVEAPSDCKILRRELIPDDEPTNTDTQSRVA